MITKRTTRVYSLIASLSGHPENFVHRLKSFNHRIKSFTGQYLSFEWSHLSISSTDFIKRATFYYIINGSTEVSAPLRISSTDKIAGPTFYNIINGRTGNFCYGHVIRLYTQLKSSELHHLILRLTTKGYHRMLFSHRFSMLVGLYRIPTFQFFTEMPLSFLSQIIKKFDSSSTEMEAVSGDIDVETLRYVISLCALV